MNVGSDDRLIADAKRLLHAAAQDLDAQKLGQLHRARRHALGGASSRRMPAGWVGAIVFATLSVLVITFIFERPIEEPRALPLLEDLDLISSIEDVELVEDLEFFGWLADPAVGGRS